MKVSQAVQLNEWVQSNRDVIAAGLKTQSELCDLAANELEFKVSRNALKQIVDNSDITVLKFLPRSDLATALEDEFVAAAKAGFLPVDVIAQLIKKRLSRRLTDALKS